MVHVAALQEIRNSEGTTGHHVLSGLPNRISLGIDFPQSGKCRKHLTPAAILQCHDQTPGLRCNCHQACPTEFSHKTNCLCSAIEGMVPVRVHRQRQDSSLMQRQSWSCASSLKISIALESFYSDDHSEELSPSISHPNTRTRSVPQFQLSHHQSPDCWIDCGEHIHIHCRHGPKRLPSSKATHATQTVLLNVSASSHWTA